MRKVVAFRGAKKAAQDNVLWKVLSRPKNRDFRSREHLLPDEVEVLMKAAGQFGCQSTFVSLIGPLPSSPLILLPEMVKTSSIHPSLIQSMNSLPLISLPIPSDPSS